MTLTTKELDQILSAVGMKFVPRDLNRDKLCKDLDRAAIWFRTAAKLHTSKVKLHNKLNQTAKTRGVSKTFLPIMVTRLGVRIPSSTRLRHMTLRKLSDCLLRPLISDYRYRPPNPHGRRA